MTESDAQNSPSPRTAPGETASVVESALAAKPKGGKGGVILVAVPLLIVAALGAAALTVWPRVERLLSGAGDLAPQVEALRQDLAATRAQVADLAARPAALAAPDGQLERRLAAVEAAQSAVSPHLAEEVKALADRVAELQKTAADAAAVLRLADRLAKAEADLRELQARRSSAAAQLLAIGQLRAAVDQALPFDAEWRAVKALTLDDAEADRVLAPLKSLAQAGIPSRSTLVDRFDRLEPAIIRAESLPEGDGWWRQSLNRLMTVVTVRREDGDAEGAAAAAVVARTRARLVANDLAAAIAEAEHLTAGPAAVARPWLDDARARLVADQSLSELTAQAVAAIGARP